MSRKAPLYQDQDRYRRGPETHDRTTELRSPRSHRDMRRSHVNARGMSRDVMQAANSFMESVGEIAKCITHRDTLRKLYTITVSRWWDTRNRSDIPRFNDVLYHICYGMQEARVKRDTFVEWKCSRDRPSYASGESRPRSGARYSYSRRSRVETESKQEQSRDSPLHRNYHVSSETQPMGESRTRFTEAPRLNDTQAQYDTTDTNSNHPSRKRRRSDRSRDGSPDDVQQGRVYCNSPDAENQRDESEQ